MTEIRNSKQYDLEERTFKFAKRVRTWVRLLPRTICNVEDARQLVRASGSVGANYIEANNSLSKKDFVLRAKVSRKEAKETWYWLGLIDPPEQLEDERQALIKEAAELVSILGAIVRKCE